MGTCKTAATRIVIVVGWHPRSNNTKHFAKMLQQCRIGAFLSLCQHFHSYYHRTGRVQGVETQWCGLYQHPASGPHTMCSMIELMSGPFSQVWRASTRQHDAFTTLYGTHVTQCKSLANTQQGGLSARTTQPGCVFARVQGYTPRATTADPFKTTYLSILNQVLPSSFTQRRALRQFHGEAQCCFQERFLGLW